MCNGRRPRSLRRPWTSSILRVSSRAHRHGPRRGPDRRPATGPSASCGGQPSGDEIRWDPDGRARSTRRRWRASAASSTWPAPASATTAGPTSTSSRSCAAGPRAPSCWRARWPVSAKPPSVLVSGSAIGFYGDRGDEVLDETSPRRHRLPRRGLRGLGGRDRARRGGRHPRGAHPHRHRAVRPGRRAEEAAPAVQGRRGRQARLRPAVAELDLDRRRGRRHPPPAGRRRPPAR